MTLTPQPARVSHLQTGAGPGLNNGQALGMRADPATQATRANPETVPSRLTKWAFAGFELNLRDLNQPLHFWATQETFEPNRHF